MSYTQNCHYISLHMSSKVRHPTMRCLHSSSSSTSSSISICLISASKNYLKSSNFSRCYTRKNATLPICSRFPPFHFRSYSSRPTCQSTWNPLQTSGFCSAASHSTAAVVDYEVEEEDTISAAKLSILKEKSLDLGISWDDTCIPGRYTYLLCPKCRGGKLIERSFSLHVNANCDFVMWRCFLDACGWAGQTYVDNSVTVDKKQTIKHKFPGHTTEKSLRLEPLSPKLIAYFAERMISRETLQRNRVMQMASDQSVLAFAYRKNGELVGCKYRTIEKKFWQESGTEKVLYGLDDIKRADEIIMVEGEMDKLSFEEAGFFNCVSVPGGAPQKVSTKELPSLDKDTAFQYLWNCKEYFEQASRIILATDSDTPGQALAEELARRLGRERCSQVCWPKKDDSSYFKDANEVLVGLGKDALKKVIENARLQFDQGSKAAC